MKSQYQASPDFGKKKKSHGLSIFILGFIAGGITALLFAPKKGKEFRSGIKKQIDEYAENGNSKAGRILSNAKSIADNYVKSAEIIFEKAKKYSETKFGITPAKLRKELLNLKTAVNAAADVYKRSRNSGNGESAINFNERYSEFVDEALPKHEGMRRGRPR